MTGRWWLAMAVLVAACFLGYAVGTGISTNRETSLNAKGKAEVSLVASRQLCAFVDNEHNKDRALIIKAEREIYHPPPTQPDSFKEFIVPFIDTPEERAEIHRKNKEAYDKIRETRPPYCAQVRKNPVPPYPKLEELR